MATELVLLGTAAAPFPVPGRAGISSALVVDGRVFVVDCGRGSPTGFADAGLDFARLEAVFVTHLHADHIGDLPGMILYPWGVRTGEHGPLRVYGPERPGGVAPQWYWLLLEQTWQRDVSWPRPDWVAGVDVDVKGFPGGCEPCEQANSHTAVLVLLADRLCCDAVQIEGEAIVQSGWQGGRGYLGN